MDVVELPLPANVVASKILTVDGFGRADKAEASGSAGRDASIFGGRKASGCSSYHRDIKPPGPPHLGRSSNFRSKMVDVDLCNDEEVLPNINCEENGDRHHISEADKPPLLLPNYEGKPLSRKSFKKLSSFPCSKRPRSDQIENLMAIDGTDDVKTITRQIESELIRFPCPEKCRMVKKKRCQDGKRTEKKNTRANMRTKYDSFISKAGFACSDSAYGGNNILGIYGLKSDLHDVTKHVDEPSLTELLDGRYNYANIRPDKGKKALNVNENILLLVRKACSVLPTYGMVDSNGNKKASLCLPHPNSCSASLSDSDDKDICVEESVPFSKIQDPCQANLGDTILYQPKVILEKLALPPTNDLDALLNLSITSPPLQSTMGMTAFQHGGLPPFSWSASHSGSWKPGVDCPKLASIKNTFHGRWARIGSISTSLGDDHNCSSELELKAFDHNEDTINQRNIDDLLQDVKALTVSVQPSFDKSFSVPHTITSISEAYIPDSTISMEGYSVSGSSSSKKLSLLADAESSVSHLELSSKNYDFVRNSKSEFSLRSLGNELNLVDPSNFNLRFKEGEFSQKEQPSGSTYGCSNSSYYYPCKSTAGGCDPYSWHLPAPEISEPGHSPRLVDAAKILYEIASCSGSIRRQNDNFRRIKWPKAPSQKTMKARKSMSSMEKTERLFPVVSHCDPVKSKGLPSIKHKSMGEKKNDFTHMKNAGREPVRWPVPVEGGASPGRLERDFNVHPRPSHSNSFRSSGPMPSPTRVILSPTRVEKGCDDQQKLRRASMKTSLLGFGGTYIKDWSRGRSKRL